MDTARMTGVDGAGVEEGEAEEVEGKKQMRKRSVVRVRETRI